MPVHSIGKDFCLLSRACSHQALDVQRELHSCELQKPALGLGFPDPRPQSARRSCYDGGMLVHELATHVADTASAFKGRPCRLRATMTARMTSRDLPPSRTPRVSAATPAATSRSLLASGLSMHSGSCRCRCTSAGNVCSGYESRTDRHSCLLLALMRGEYVCSSCGQAAIAALEKEASSLSFLP